MKFSFIEMEINYIIRRFNKNSDEKIEFIDFSQELYPKERYFY